MKITAAKVIEFLKSKLGEDYYEPTGDCWIEHDYAFGSTEAGFWSAYEINYAKLEQEMDKWISETFGKD